MALIKTAQDCGAPVRIVETVVAVNEQRKRAMARKVIGACGGSVRSKTIAIFGLTFKPNTDDVREAPSLAIISTLQDSGAHIRAHDPHGIPGARSLLSDVSYAPDPYGCVKGADALVIITEWDAFRALDFNRIRELMRAPVLVDLRNIYPGRELQNAGFRYESVGRPHEAPWSLRDQSSDHATTMSRDRVTPPAQADAYALPGIDPSARAREFAWDTEISAMRPL
jgi:UDPglucose 6-dehydrogenase